MQTTLAEDKKEITHAIEQAKKQRDISISEFFTKNRHLLGFDNPLKAISTTIKEGVDNALDAAEDANILPDVIVEIKQTTEDRFLVTIEDNGPGIVKEQIPNIFGKLLYGSKFHKLSQTRGQQGIGISAAGLYGQLTTGKPVKITSKIGKTKPAYYYELHLDTAKNEPEITKTTSEELDEKSAETDPESEIIEEPEIPIFSSANLRSVKNAFLAELGETAEFKIEITLFDPEFCRGKITVKSEEPKIFLAAKKSHETWIIPFYGNEEFPCELLDALHFPMEMISECTE